MNMNGILPFFVYGTLLPGQPNYHLWEKAIRREEPAVFSNGRLYDMARLSLGHYPMMVEGRGWQVERGRWQVVGLMVEVEPAQYAEVLRVLDSLEDFRPQQPEASFYLRVKRLVTLTSGEQRVVWVYVGREVLVGGLEPIVGGNWKAYSAHRQQEAEAWWAAGGGVPSTA